MSGSFDEVLHTAISRREPMKKAGIGAGVCHAFAEVGRPTCCDT
jgi:hypothetical protein